MTKEIRHQIYCKALEIFMNYHQPYGWYNGICASIDDAIQRLELTEIATNPFANISAFSEIYKHKPPHIEMYNEEFWFDWTSTGTQKRIDILKQAIEETKP